VFHAVNARSALKLGHARGVALLAAVEAGCAVVEYTPAEVKRAVVGYGRADKHQVQQMVKLLLGLDKAPSPFDASDALAVAICHLHSAPLAGIRDQGSGIKNDGDRVLDPRSLIPDPPSSGKRQLKSWRQYRPPANG
jgi:crossover junction endodeoxyribonuclease RuvC